MENGPIVKMITLPGSWSTLTKKHTPLLSVKPNKSLEVVYCRDYNCHFEKDLLLTPRC